MYPAPRVTALIDKEFIPVRIHIKENPTAWHRFHVRWTPTIAVLDSEGKEIWRVEGYLPEEEFLAQLELALAFNEVNHKEWKKAEERFAHIESTHPNTEAGPQALYWKGVSRYSGTHDASALAETTRWFDDRYQNTSWAKRASIWKK